MIGYLARRVVQATIVVFGVTLLVFLLEHIIPGGAARAALGQRATPVQIEQFNKLNGYDLPIWHQFYDYCRGLVLHFNLGYSYKKNQTVSALIEEDLPKTLVLVGISTVVAVVVAVPLGVLQVVRRNKPIDYFLTGTAFIFYAMPAFLLGPAPDPLLRDRPPAGSRPRLPRRTRPGASSPTRATSSCRC